LHKKFEIKQKATILPQESITQRKQNTIWQGIAIERLNCSTSEAIDFVLIHSSNSSGGNAVDAWQPCYLIPAVPKT